MRERIGDLYDALTARGAVAAAFSPVGLTATLPEDLTAHDVLALARKANVQIRTLEPQRESMEQAFLRVVSSPAPIGADGPYRTTTGESA